MEIRMGAARALAALAAVVACSASAQLVSSIAVQPAPVKAGELATITVQFDVVAGTNCGLRLHWGDGSSGDYKINQAKDIPLVVQHSWDKPGSYVVKAEGKSQGMTVKCGGRNQETTLVVSAPPAAVPAAAAAPAPAPATPAANATMARSGTCPAGWTLNKPGVGKNGGFTCGAKPGTSAPAQRVECPGDLTYFENTKRGQLGCRP
jgi:hypothetical protein